MDLAALTPTLPPAPKAALDPSITTEPPFAIATPEDTSIEPEVDPNESPTTILTEPDALDSAERILNSELDVTSIEPPIDANDCPACMETEPPFKPGDAVTRISPLANDRPVSKTTSPDFPMMVWPDPSFVAPLLLPEEVSMETAPDMPVVLAPEANNIFPPFATVDSPATKLIDPPTEVPL